MMAACDLLISDIHHTRHGPPHHFLARRGLSIWIDLDHLEQANQQSRFFSVGRFNVLSFFEADYGPNFRQTKPAVSLSAYVRDLAGEILPDAHVAHVRLLTFPRIFGLSFNPLSVYVAQNDQGVDILYIYEVRNTFGDMHAYIGAPQDGQSILQAQKIFHVSPFFPVSGTYRLHIRHNAAQIKLAMRYLIGTKPALTATMRVFCCRLPAVLCGGPMAHRPVAITPVSIHPCGSGKVVDEKASISQASVTASLALVASA